MAQESSLPQDLMVTKKKLKKTRSIKLAKVPSLKPSSRRSKSRFNWLSIDLNDLNKDSSQGGSEIDEEASVESSSNGSSNLPNLNQTARIQKMLKTYGGSRSFRRRTKSRTIQRPVVSSKGAATQEDLLSVDDRDGSPHYLKATSSSEGRKTNSQGSSKSSLSLHETNDQNSSHMSTPSVRSVRIQLNKTSLKPKKASFKGSHSSQDLNVDRATCSSTFKDKRFPEQLELSSDEQKSIMKACPYQHCSLHGHKKDAAPAPKSFSYKKRQSLTPHTNMKPGSNSASVVNVSGDKKQESSSLTPVKKEKDVSFSIEIHATIKAQFSCKTDEGTGDSGASEITLGESSCLLDSQKDSLNEMMSSLIKSLSDLKEKSVGCRCKSEVHEPSFPSAQEDSEVGDILAPNIEHEEHEPTTYDQSEDSSVDDSSHLPVNPEAQVNETKFGDDSDIGSIDLTKISTVDDHHSTEQLDTSAGENTSETLEDGITLGRDIKDNEAIPGESLEPSSHHEEFQAKLGGGKNISMWQMIHQRMISSLASDVEERPPQTENEENQVEDTDKSPAVLASADTEKQEDKDNQRNDAMNQDIELRKVLAIKLVREAIERILLPEVPDQSSDDQSTTSETTSEQDLSEQNHAEEYLKDSKSETDLSCDTKESGSFAVSKDEIQQVKTVKKLEDKSEKKAPKHWSNLKKWIILQRFVKALEKLKKINPRGPNFLQLEPEPEGEKVTLRPQTVEEKKNGEEWMLDYALRQAISQLAPTQKKKVSLLVKAFETVVPPVEDSDIHSTISKLRDTSDKSPKGKDKKQENVVSDYGSNPSTENKATNSSVTVAALELSGRTRTAPKELVQEGKSHEEMYEAGTSNVEAAGSSADPLVSSSETIVQESDRAVETGGSKPTQGPYLVEPSSDEEEKKNNIKMWHMVYQHVFSSIVEKVGDKLLDGTDDDDSENATEAAKLVQEAVDEILLPEIQDDLSETQSVTSDTVSGQELSEKIHIEDQEGAILNQNISSPPKAKNWSKLKMLMLLKRSIRALEKARKTKSQLQNIMQLKADSQPETADMRRQMMDEKKKAEQWMLDYAVQNIVHTLTPARKRRVSMLVEAFEAVVPLPDL